MLYQRSSALFEEAYKYIPGGVNSPVRAFKSVGGVPIFMKSAKGAYLTDVTLITSILGDRRFWVTRIRKFWKL